MIIGKVQTTMESQGKTVWFNCRIVSSSNVYAIGWPTSGEPLMLVVYKNETRYGYLGVSRQRAVAAALSPSVGKYLHKKVKGKYKAVRLV